MKRRRGFSLMELLVVLAILIVLGAIIAPTMRSLTGDTKVKAATDQVKSHLATARASAMEQGRPYCVSVSPDGLQLRVGPADPTTQVSTPESAGADDGLPESVQLEVMAEEADEYGPMLEADGWIRFVTYKPDGTCEEPSAGVRVVEPGMPPMIVRVRGMTGASEVVQPPPAGATS